jgi:predicted DNA-binding transcriptional regulator AlpA
MHHLVGMAEIAEMLGVSRQRVAQLIETYEDFPKPEVELTGGRVWSRNAIESWIASHPERTAGRPEEPVDRKGFFGRRFGGLFTRFTDRARSAVVKAQEEARLLNHNYIGTEHLLLGLLAIGEGLAYQVLALNGITHEAVRTDITREVGRGTSTPQGRIPFTPRAKKVLELGLREAMHLGHNYVGTEHVLLGIIRETDGVGWKALERLGLSEGAARDAVMSAIAGFTAPIATSMGAPPLTCSFCGRPRDEVKTLVAGPGSLAICDACIGDAAGVVAEEAGAEEALGAAVEDRLAQFEERLKRLEGGE